MTITELLKQLVDTGAYCIGDFMCHTLSDSRVDELLIQQAGDEIRQTMVDVAALYGTDCDTRKHLDSGDSVAFADVLISACPKSEEHRGFKSAYRFQQRFQVELYGDWDNRMALIETFVKTHYQ